MSQQRETTLFELGHHPEIATIAAEVLKALGHPLRLQMIALLANGDLTVTELSEQTETPQAIVSQQLRILRMRGLVKAARSNGFAHYTLAEPGLANLVGCIEKCSFCRWARDRADTTQSEG